MHLLCWNRIENFERWRKIFASHKEAHRQAGLDLVELWLEKDDPTLVHYLFEVRDQGKAVALMRAPDAAEAARDAGVHAGEFHFVESQGGY